jgi:hypothetical protein
VVETHLKPEDRRTLGGPVWPLWVIDPANLSQVCNPPQTETNYIQRIFFSSRTLLLSLLFHLLLPRHHGFDRLEVVLSAVGRADTRSPEFFGGFQRGFSYDESGFGDPRVTASGRAGVRWEKWSPKRWVKIVVSSEGRADFCLCDLGIPYRGVGWLTNNHLDHAAKIPKQTEDLARSIRGLHQAAMDIHHTAPKTVAE